FSRDWSSDVCSSDLLSNKVRDTDWYKTLDLRTPSEAIFVKAYKEDSISSGRTEQFKDTFNIIRVMDYFDSLGTWDKVLKIELKTEAFDVILGNLNIPGSVYLVDPDGIIQYTTNRNINWREEQLAIDSIHTGSHTV